MSQSMRSFHSGLKDFSHVIAYALRSGHVPTAGQSVASVLPPISRFRPDNARTETMQRVYAKLQEFVDRFRPLLRSDFEE